MTKRFLIPSLLAAGFGSHDPLQAALTEATATSGDDPGNASLFQIFRQDHRVTLAQHRSHRSHSSHRSGSGSHYSHASHRSVEPSVLPIVLTAAAANVRASAAALKVAVPA